MIDNSRPETLDHTLDVSGCDVRGLVGPGGGWGAVITSARAYDASGARKKRKKRQQE